MKDIASGTQVVSAGAGNNIYMPYKWILTHTWGHEGAHNIRHAFVQPSKTGYLTETDVLSPALENELLRAFPGIDSGKYAKYFSKRDEVLARGTQIKNYFNTNHLTGDQIKEYLNLLETGKLENRNALDLLKNHVNDHDAAANFFNLYSFRTGGRLNKYPK